MLIFMKLPFLIVCCLISTLRLNAQYQFSTGFGISALNSNTFSDIPIKPTSNKVDVFLSGEYPTQDYYKVRVLEVTGSNSYNDLLANLKTLALQLGFDAVQVLSRTEYQTQDNSVGTAITKGLVSGLVGNKNADYRAPIINQQRLSAIAIKYKSNMDYVNNIVKHASITLHDSSRTVYNLSFSLNGTALETSNNKDSRFYLTNISLFKFADFFTQHHATSSSDDWESKTSTGKLETDSGTIKYKAYYINDSLVEKVQIKMPSSEQYESVKLYTISYDFNASTITKRSIKVGRHSELVFADVYEYDSKMNCIGFTRYNAKTNQEVFKVNYDYFHTNDLPEAVKAPAN